MFVCEFKDTTTPRTVAKKDSSKSDGKTVAAGASKTPKRRLKKPKVSIEYELETEDQAETRQRVHN